MKPPSAFGVVDQSVEVLDARRLEARAVLVLIELGEDVLEAVVVGLADGVLGGEPQVLFGAQRVLEATAGEARDGGVQVVHALDHAGPLELVDELAGLAAVGGGEDELGAAGPGHADLGVLVDVTVGMAGDGDGALPAADDWLDAAHHDGRAEHGAVQHGADGAVGALPHPLEAVFLDALGVGGDGGALHGHAQALGGLGGVDGHLVVREVAVPEAEVKVLGLEVHEGQDQVVLDHLPDDAGHLVAVHLNERGLHLDFGFCHACLPNDTCTPMVLEEPAPASCGYALATKGASASQAPMYA